MQSWYATASVQAGWRGRVKHQVLSFPPNPMKYTTRPTFPTIKAGQVGLAGLVGQCVTLALNTLAA
eukprot:4024059-Pyramimonas_sp.AAC.1